MSIASETIGGTPIADGQGQDHGSKRPPKKRRKTAVQDTIQQPEAR